MKKNTKFERLVYVMNLLKRIDSIYLPARDPEKSIEWYMRHLGLTRPLDNNPGILQTDNGTWVFFLKSITRTTSNFATSDWVEGGNFDMFSITFEVEDANQLYDKLQTEGVELDTLRDEGGCGFQFTFYDLDGNKFNVYQAK
jgi:glyoxylase I family protein